VSPQTSQLRVPQFFHKMAQNFGIFAAVRIHLPIVEQWGRPDESLGDVLHEILHGLVPPDIALPFSQCPHKVSFLLHQILPVPLIYLVCLCNHI
jgi:hypothetical protein